MIRANILRHSMAITKKDMAGAAVVSATAGVHWYSTFLTVRALNDGVLQFVNERYQHEYNQFIVPALLAVVAGYAIGNAIIAASCYNNRNGFKSEYFEGTSAQFGKVDPSIRKPSFIDKVKAAVYGIMFAPTVSVGHSVIGKN